MPANPSWGKFQHHPTLQLRFYLLQVTAYRDKMFIEKMEQSSLNLFHGTSKTLNGKIGNFSSVTTATDRLRRSIQAKRSKADPNNPPRYAVALVLLRFFLGCSMP
jgi:hypothetical protein